MKLNYLLSFTISDSHVLFCSAFISCSKHFVAMLHSLLPLAIVSVLHFLPRTVNADQLLLAQAVWRHGDRAPTDTFHNDPNKEEAWEWTQGWGQLTVTGMEEHVKLGQKLRERYIEQLKLVDSRYHSNQIYLRSTDLNRTLTSTMSNMIGFYGAGVRGEDYPQNASWWPSGFIPIAVHTIGLQEDHIMPDVPDVPCPRQDKLQELVRRTPEYTQLMSERKWFFDTLDQLAGEHIDIYSFWVIVDTLFIENKYRDRLPHPMPEWTQNETLKTQIREVDELLDDWTNGKGLKPFEGVDFEMELARIRGGPLLWILIGNMQNKLACERGELLVANKRSPLGSPLCQWIAEKRYFAYSAHDTTISALFAAFGFDKTNYDTDGYPQYAACVTVELWRKDSSREHYIRVWYWPPDKAGAEEITANITGCGGGCSLDSFLARSKPYQPLPSTEEYCRNTHFPSGYVRSQVPPFTPTLLLVGIVLLISFHSSLSVAQSEEANTF